MLFGRKKKNPSKAEAGKLIADFLAHQADTENMKSAARANDTTVAVLHPEIPIGSTSETGWFGGLAALPEDMAWPEANGEKLIFVGQVNLAVLPQELWGGIGPRSGWLGFFLPRKWPHKPTVVHFDGPLVEVKGPLPNSADWTRSHDFKSPETFALPRWPVVIERLSGPAYFKRCEEPRPDDRSRGSLLDPAYLPFDKDTVSFLLKALNTAVTAATQAIIRFPQMNKLAPQDAAWFERNRQPAIDTFVRFLEIEGAMRANRRPDGSSIARLVDSLSDLAIFDFKHLRTGPNGVSELELLQRKLLDEADVFTRMHSWWYEYEAALRNHAMKAYTTHPDTLPMPLRERLEAEWRRETYTGLGAMGHAPAGHIYTPHGPDSPNEVLLELHTRKLAGWIWGDCYSLVILIEREALAAGDFSNLLVDITN